MGLHAEKGPASRIISSFLNWMEQNGPPLPDAARHLPPNLPLFSSIFNWPTLCLRNTKRATTPTYAGYAVKLLSDEKKNSFLYEYSLANTANTRINANEARLNFKLRLNVPGEAVGIPRFAVFSPRLCLSKGAKASSRSIGKSH